MCCIDVVLRLFNLGLRQCPWVRPSQLLPLFNFLREVSHQEYVSPAPRPNNPPKPCLKAAPNHPLSPFWADSFHSFRRLWNIRPLFSGFLGFLKASTSSRVPVFVHGAFAHSDRRCPRSQLSQAGLHQVSRVWVDLPLLRAAKK